MAFTEEQLIKLYTGLVRTRAFDLMFIRRLTEGRFLGFYHPALGGEAPGVGTCSVLRPDDYLYGHIRGHGLPHMIGKGGDPKYLLAEHCGKATGSCGGISTFHSVDVENGTLGAAGTIGSNFPVTIGYGLAAKMNGRGQVAVCSFGDGTSNRGTFHECALMVNNWNLPVVFVCENNGMSMYVPVADSHPVDDIADLAHGYGMPGVVVDGQDVIAVAEAVQLAVDRARAGGGPSMIEAKCERFMSHSIGVPDWEGGQLRSEDTINYIKENRDPIRICQEKLLDQGVLTRELIEKIEADAQAEADAAETFADESPIPENIDFDALLYA